jgi:phage FluMu protein Com
MAGWIASDLQPRCKQCGKLLAEKVTRPWVIRCGRCKTTNSGDDRTMPATIVLEADPPAT